MHSANHAGSGSTVIIRDPSTGMWINLTYGPGQMEKSIIVEMNGKVYSVKARLRPVHGDLGDDDLEFYLTASQVPYAASGPAEKAQSPKPHPATTVTWMDEQQQKRRDQIRENDKAEKLRERGDGPPDFQQSLKERASVQKELKDHKPEREPVGDDDSDINPDFVMDDDEAKANLAASKAKPAPANTETIELVESTPVKETPAGKPAASASPQPTQKKK